MIGAAAAPMSPFSSVTSSPPSRRQDLLGYYSACAATFLTANFICPAQTRPASLVSVNVGGAGSTIKYQPYPCQQLIQAVINFDPSFIVTLGHQHFQGWPMSGKDNVPVQYAMFEEGFLSKLHTQGENPQEPGAAKEARNEDVGC
ncbi:hypothetical protein CF326_g10057 [Tilletia indica]|nr:hypothetical protein CF326_g10057 [Tilletia indica]